MLMKQYIQEINNGKGIVFATGTISIVLLKCM